MAPATAARGHFGASGPASDQAGGGGGQMALELNGRGSIPRCALTGSPWAQPEPPSRRAAPRPGPGCPPKLVPGPLPPRASEASYSRRMPSTTSEAERLCCRTALPRLYARASAELLWLSATGPSERLTRAQLQLAAGISSKRSEQLANWREKLCRRRCRRLADWGAHQPADASVAAPRTREDPS